MIASIYPGVAQAQEPNDWFESKVRPILVEHCYECHSGTKSKGGLVLDSKLGWSQGGPSNRSQIPSTPSAPNRSISNIASRVPQDQQRLELEFLAKLNADHLASRSADENLKTRLQTFETAFGMQMAVPEVFDLSQESQAMLTSYGLKPGQTTEFGRTPFNNTADAKGREHHPWAFSSWLAGAGVKPEIV